ncbi:MAG: hypothetical protein Q8K18_09580 [Burkholderiales bacterium]|nr:hypothetical protein [Burkholderiales bacterium]
MYYEGSWVDSFPKNYQLPNATSITKGLALWGAVALGKIDELVQRLHQQRAAWPEAWGSAMGGRMERKG